MIKKYLLAIIIVFAFANLTKAQSFYDFTLNDLNGDDVTLSELIKKGPVMISFWATWCAPCKDEMRYMNDIWAKYKDKGFTYLAVNNDNQKSISKVKSFISANGYEFPVVLDTDQKIFEAYQGSGHPFSVIIGTDGTIIARHLGYVPGDEVKFEEEIKANLN